MLKKEYESVIFNNIINQLAYVRDEERKPYFPADLIIQKTIETCEYTIDKGVVRISSMQQATAMMKDLINGKFGIGVDRTLEVMCMLWNRFFGCHYTNWDLSTEEWLVANMWLVWIKEFSGICVENSSEYLKRLDCSLVRNENVREPSYSGINKVIEKLNGVGTITISNKFELFRQFLKVL